MSGRVGGAQFGHFNNLGPNGVGVYSGASTYARTSTDLLSVSLDIRYFDMRSLMFWLRVRA